MNWTDERVEKLKRLWAEGLSASQIATQLGGVSRNAVIGKAHRLNLAVRSKAGRPRASGTSRAPRTKPAVSPPTSSSGLVCAPYVAEAQAPTPSRAVSTVVPTFLRLTLTDLNEHTCKWPVGDPLKDDFFFCGVGTEETYCGYHAKIAYQPARESRRSKPSAATTYENA